MINRIDIMKAVPHKAKLRSLGNDSAEIIFSGEEGSVELFGPEELKYRYLTGFVEAKEEHSVSMDLKFYRKNEKERRIGYRFGLLPGVRTRICIDLELIDARTVFTERTPGTLKMVIHGNRMRREEAARIEFGIKSCFHDVKAVLSDFYLTDDKPEDFPLPEEKLVDIYGQWEKKTWPGKVISDDDLKTNFEKQRGDSSYPFPEWNKWGGNLNNKLCSGTGYFKTIKTKDGRWHIADPDGFEYFSIGCDCVNPGDSARIDSFINVCEELPPTDDRTYSDCYQERSIPASCKNKPERILMYNYTKSNLIRIYGSEWHRVWKETAEKILKGYGFNTVANWSDPSFRENAKRIPYVIQPNNFPTTRLKIFRDFPDVMSEEYAVNAEKFAMELKPYAGDPWLVGYFMRNEPEFAFVPGLLIADEVLRNPADSACRKAVIKALRGKYADIGRLNEKWNSEFSGFEDLGKPIPSVKDTYPGAGEDLSALSKMLIENYVGIPSRACKKADADHMNLGMRWAVADTAEQLAGWENFDVFSINSYNFSPYRDIEFAVSSGVDRPIMIGEFHFGALDRGMTATGLKAVTSQKERGKAFRYYIEQCASHPNAVGSHWFQYNDQSCLGRFDGENYQIGLVDICGKPYEEICEAARESASVIYEVKNGQKKPFDQIPAEIPMIGY